MAIMIISLAFLIAMAAYGRVFGIRWRELFRWKLWRAVFRMRRVDMTPETLEALKGSIEKWRRIVEDGGADEGIKNCPLCALYWHNGCLGCPISEVTDSILCDNTPYQTQWGPLIIPLRATVVADTPQKLVAARAELEFLRSLLPKEASE